MSGETDRFHPPDALLEIARILESRGYQAWAVGGAVRDALLGRDRADWDLATDARPRDVQRVFPRTVPIGVEHGTVGVLGSDDEMYEVTTFRRDVETDGRHAVVEFATEIDEDLARRDFTINALAWRPATEELRDPFDGEADMERGVLRAVGEPDRRFAEDYLRVLRGLRFAGRFRLEIEPDTREALVGAVGGLEELSAERVREELWKVMGDRKPSEALRLYREVGALKTWYPEVRKAAEGDPRWESNLGAVDAIPAHRRLLRLVRWLIPIGEEDELRAKRGERLLRRLKFSNAAIRRATHLLRHYQPLPSPVDSAATLREWLAETGEAAIRDVFRLHAADARGSGATEKARYLVATWRRVHEELLSSPPLVLGDLELDGNDLVELGVRQGPEVGIILDELHARVLEEPEANERETLLALAREMMEMGGLGAHPEGPDGNGRDADGPTGGGSADASEDVDRGVGGNG